MEPKTLQTERLMLMGVTPARLRHLFSTKTKVQLLELFGVDEKGFLHYQEMAEKGTETHRISMHYFLLISKETGLTIGECGFHTLNKTHRRTELFYLLRQDADKQKGLMTEALTEVLRFGFEELNLHRVEALVDKNNTASVKLLQKNGFVKEGTMREDYCVNGVNEDSDCYSLLKHEWESRVKF